MAELYSCTLSLFDNSSCSEVSLVEDDMNNWLVYVTLTSIILPRQHYQAQLEFGNSAGNTEKKSTVITFS